MDSLRGPQDEAEHRGPRREVHRGSRRGPLDQALDRARGRVAKERRHQARLDARASKSAAVADRQAADPAAAQVGVAGEAPDQQRRRPGAADEDGAWHRLRSYVVARASPVAGDDDLDALEREARGVDQHRDRHGVRRDEARGELDEAPGDHQDVVVAGHEAEAREGPRRDRVRRRRRPVEDLLDPQAEVGDQLARAEQARAHVRCGARGHLAVPVTGHEVERDAARALGPGVVARHLEGVDQRVDEPREVRGRRARAGSLGAPPPLGRAVRLAERVEQLESLVLVGRVARGEQRAGEHRVPLQDDLGVTPRRRAPRARGAQCGCGARQRGRGRERLTGGQSRHDASLERAGLVEPPPGQRRLDLSLLARVA